VSTGKAIERKPLMKRREAPHDIRTRPYALVWDQFGGYLFTARAVSGVKVARAWSWVLHGTCEAGSISSRDVGGAGEPQAAKSVRASVPLVESVAGRPE
jgi:hypothetical protein